MRVVLAFSGGLDTSWCIPYLLKQGHEVITVTVDVGGFSESEQQEICERSQVLGANSHVWIQAEDKFFDQMVRFLIAGNVLRGGTYPLCVGAERSLQAQEVAKIAKQVEADAVCHGCTAAGNDQFRFETAFRTYAPGMEILAPVRDETPSRAKQLSDLLDMGVEFQAEKAAYSVNSGLWGVTIGGVETTGTHDTIPESAWQRTKGAFDDFREPAAHQLRFEQGVPIAFDGAEGCPTSVIKAVDDAAAQMGIGRGIHLGETILGIKGRVAFEAPAASVILQAHRELEKLTLTKREISLKDYVATQYGDWIHEGLGTDPAARHAEALLESSQRHVTGTVQLLFRQGSCFVTGVDSPYSLHAASKAVYGESVGEWEADDARGFAKIYGLPSVIHARTEASL